MRTFRLPLFALLLSLVLAACGGADDTGGSASAPAISGRINAGLRVLTFDPADTAQHFTIYRGDYVHPELVTGEEFTIEIPALEVSRSFPAAEDESPYFKVPDTGTFAFRIGEAGGTIEAIDYTAAQYREIGAREAAEMIDNVDPLVLDVRTGREYAGGHLDGAVLIPVQELHGRIGELSAHKREPVLIYCASGNRSTVAAKMLVDAGFNRVVNMRYGIKEWYREGLPTVK